MAPQSHTRLLLQSQFPKRRRSIPKFDWRLVLVLALPLVAKRPMPAQNAAPANSLTTLTVTTHLVVLDVVVTDKNGVPVTGLTKDDFIVLEDKERQEIRNFEPPAQHALPPGNIVHSTADIARIGTSPVNILVLDELDTPFEDNAFSRYSLQRFLKAQPGILPPTELLVANDQRFTVLEDYTQNLETLEAALKRDPVEYPWRLARSGNSGPEAIVRLAQTLNSLDEIAQASAGTPGRKNIIWVGKGFPSVDMTGLSDAASKQLQNAIKRCTDLLLGSRVTLYLVDPSPLSSATYDTQKPTDLATLESETATEPFSNAVRFSALATVTGGRIFSMRNDVEREIATSMQNGALYYTLSYSPTNDSDESGAYRSIRVALTRPGLSATTRDGYYTAPPTSGLTASGGGDTGNTNTNGEEVGDIANAALSRMVYNGLKVRAGRIAPGRFSIAIADSSLSWRPNFGDLSQASVSVVAVCFSGSGKVLSHIATEKTLVTKSLNSSRQNEEVFTMPIDLPAGTTRLRLVFRDAQTGHLGTADLGNP
jgi:VWFA-related protein